MHVVAPKEMLTCRSKGQKSEWIERTYDCVIACNNLKGIFADEGGWKTLSRGRTKQCLSWSRERGGDTGME